MRVPKRDSATLDRPTQMAMAGPARAASGANSSVTPTKSSSGSGSRGTAPDGRGTGNSKATPAYQPEPTYPAFARRQGYEGQVIIRVQVSSTGSVGAVRIVRSSGYAMLDETALSAIKRWRFRPAQQGGKPVEATLNVPITFKLHKQG
ncbi:MAG: energy transducer TonB [Candidatus Competibacteraceae bacterium]|nr:energy transducer TonB [Candidatus Competibacteraceae bacterium]